LEGFVGAILFLGGSEASVRFRFFWEEGIVKKEDMVVSVDGVFLLERSEVQGGFEVYQKIILPDGNLDRGLDEV